MSQFRSPLIWRLILWFLLLSLIPVGIVLVFVQRQVRVTFIDQQIQSLSEQASLLSNQIADQPARTQAIIDEYGNESQSAFILDKNGSYIANSIPSKIGTSASEDVNPEILQQLLTDSSTKINNVDQQQFIASVKDSTGNFVIAITTNSTVQLKTIGELSRGVILQLVVSLLITSLAGGAAIVVVLNPILQLSRFADRLAGGELEALHDDSELEGEIAILAKSLNNLAVRIREAISNLEQRVIERTKDLEESSRKIEKRASQLEAIADTASSVASLQDVDQLLPHITKLINERFGFYHAGIFLLSEDNEYAVLRAANSEGGQKMLSRKHRLRVGQEGIVGVSIAQKRARVALDVGKDAVFFNNPDLPATRSELALPLMIGSVVIGVLDVQSEQPNAFSEEDIKVLGTLANQVAVAIENARLYQQSQEALKELDNTFQRYMSNEWRQFVEKSTFIGYRASESGIEAIAEPNKTTNSKVDNNSLRTVPIRLRGTTLGSLNINMGDNGQEYTEEESNLIQTITDRLALALESARLLEESQKAAAKEQVIGEITGKIGSSINLRNVLQTAVEELGHNIPGSEIVIQLNPQSGNEAN